MDVFVAKWFDSSESRISEYCLTEFQYSKIYDKKKKKTNVVHTSCLCFVNLIIKNNTLGSVHCLAATQEKKIYNKRSKFIQTNFFALFHTHALKVNFSLSAPTNLTIDCIFASENKRKHISRL